MDRIKLGQEVKDAITGFTGVVTGMVQYITGCNQALVQPRCKEDGSYVDSKWWDVDRLEVLADNAVSLPANTTNGPDIEAPRR